MSCLTTTLVFYCEFFRVTIAKHLYSTQGWLVEGVASKRLRHFPSAVQSSNEDLIFRSNWDLTLFYKFSEWDNGFDSFTWTWVSLVAVKGLPDSRPSSVDWKLFLKVDPFVTLEHYFQKFASKVKTFPWEVKFHVATLLPVIAHFNNGKTLK